MTAARWSVCRHTTWRRRERDGGTRTTQGRVQSQLSGTWTGASAGMIEQLPHPCCLQCCGLLDGSADPEALPLPSSPVSTSSWLSTRTWCCIAETCRKSPPKPQQALTHLIQNLQHCVTQRLSLAALGGPALLLLASTLACLCSSSKLCPHVLPARTGRQPHHITPQHSTPCKCLGPFQL